MQRVNGLHKVAVQLRAEVGFVCPIPDCDEACLTFHHFDPPWREKKHNNPNGMIALCQTCHNRAEGSAWTNEEFRNFKKTAIHTKKKVSDRIKIADTGKEHLWQLGNNFALGCRFPLLLAGRPVIASQRSEEGHCMFSVQVSNLQEQVMFSIHNNSFSSELNGVYDFHWNTTANRIVFREKKGQVNLDLRIVYLTEDELRNQMDKYSNEALKILAERMSGSESLLADRHTFSLVGQKMGMILPRCQNSDGRIAVIRIERARFHALGRLLLVRNGKALERIHSCFVADCNDGFSLAGFPQLKKLWDGATALHPQAAKVLVREKLLSEQNGEQTCEGVNRLFAMARSDYPATLMLGCQLLVQLARSLSLCDTGGFQAWRPCDGGIDGHSVEGGGGA